jgi:hypothetical protein
MEKKIEKQLAPYQEKSAIEKKNIPDAVMKEVEAQMAILKKRAHVVMTAMEEEVNGQVHGLSNLYEEWWNKHWPRLEQAGKMMNDDLVKIFIELGRNQQTQT